MEISEDEYHDRVMAVVDTINDSLSNKGDEYSVTVNALLTLLAMAGKDATLSQRDFCMHVAVQLDMLMSSMSVEHHSIQ